MSLVNYAKQNIEPTADQENAFLAIDEFLKSGEKCFLLKGYAGTGKTTITKTIAEYVNHKKYDPVLLAPTGRAARILSDKTGFEANTIHRGIYNLDQVDEIEIKVDGKKQFKFRFNLLEVKTNITQIYLIDEASMISDRRTEDDFFVFGSGILLKDILDFIAIGNKARRDKIIFIGDPAQLPPVSDPISGALSRTYLKEKYNLKTQEYELTQVVRQAQESGILKIAEYLRNRLQPRADAHNFAIETYDDVAIINPEAIAEHYRILNPELDINQTAIVNFSNKSALEYNLAVRDTFFNNRFNIQKGDLLMINQNNYNFDIPLYNGTMVKVIQASPNLILRNNMPSYDQLGNRCKVNFRFRNITIAVPTPEKIHRIDCFILDDFLYSEIPRLKYEEQMALYIDFKMRHPNLRPKTKPFTDALINDPYFNALRVKYGYAITCHKAQGGEWSSVMVNLDLNLGKHSESFNRWLYTAITRASKKLYLFNYQQISSFSTLDFICQYLEEENAKINEMSNISFQLPTDLEELYHEFGLDKEEGFQREKFKDLLARTHHYGYRITQRTPHNYQEQYTFEKASQIGTLVFWYNGQQRFTRTTIYNTPNQNREFSQQLLSNLEAPHAITFEEKGIDTPKPQSFAEMEASKTAIFPEEYQALSLLYDNLKSLLKEKEILIEDVIHGQFHEMYQFRRREEEAVIQFHYNAKNQFTRATNLKKKCNSNALLKDLEEAIQILKTEN